jgi:hypothetical protein
VLFDLVEEAGGRIALDATETGRRGQPRPFDRRRIAEEPLMELADAYLGIADASRRPNSNCTSGSGKSWPAPASGVLFHHMCGAMPGGRSLRG